MDLQLRDDVAWIVGGAQGIGRAIADAFAAEGSRVVIVDRSTQSKAVAEAIGREHHVAARGITLDVTDAAAIEQAVAETLTLWGRIDHVVYAAGMGSGKYGFPFWNLTPADWPRVIEVNLLGAVNVAHAVAPAMTAARRGTLLFISSVAAQIGSQTDPPYSASKAALINFAHCAAKDFAPFDVRVNVLAPGMVQTELNRSVWAAWNAQQPVDAQKTYEEWAGEKVRRVAPLGRWQQPEDLAAMAVFLASPRARNVTGQTLNVDGGQVMHA